MGRRASCVPGRLPSRFTLVWNRSQRMPLGLVVRLNTLAAWAGSRKPQPTALSDLMMLANDQSQASQVPRLKPFTASFLAGVQVTASSL
ncbi:hypothetical protein D3C71_1944550 [compost metagenome]